MLQKPTSLKALAEAATIGEVNARTTGARTKADDSTTSAQLAEMRAMVAVMQDMMAANQAQIGGARGHDPPAPRREQPTCATTTTAAINSTARYHPSAAVPRVNKGSEPHDTATAGGDAEPQRRTRQRRTTPTRTGGEVSGAVPRSINRLELSRCRRPPLRSIRPHTVPLINRRRGAGSPSNTMWPRLRPTCMPTFVLTCQKVWPQYTNVTDRQDRTGQTTVR